MLPRLEMFRTAGDAGVRSPLFLLLPFSPLLYPASHQLEAPRANNSELLPFANV